MKHFIQKNRKKSVTILTIVSFILIGASFLFFGIGKWGMTAKAEGIQNPVRLAQVTGDPVTSLVATKNECQENPYLTFGIAGVKTNDQKSYQYSTAEILVTCKKEYKLIENTVSIEPE